MFSQVKKLHLQKDGYLDKLFGSAGIPKDPLIDQQKGDKICSYILKNLGSDFTLGYAENDIWAVLPSIKKVMRPPDYLLTREEFIGIICHEIGSHLMETVNGEKQSLLLLSSGLAGMDGYEKSNEGRALLREQIVYESPAQYKELPFWQYCVSKHLAISLACGLYDHKYNFREVYNVIFELSRFWNKKRAPEAEDNLARDMAWHMAVRVLKGTDGTGDAYRKDIVYVEGNLKCWQLAVQSPEIILAGDLGKFDIANPSHLRILHGLGIINPSNQSG